MSEPYFSKSWLPEDREEMNKRLEEERKLGLRGERGRKQYNPSAKGWEYVYSRADLGVSV